MTTPSGPQRRRTARRRGFTLAAVASAVVATVFLTVGDGVDVPTASGTRRLIIDHGHIAVWALLAAAFAVAARRASWNRASQVLAVTAGAVYLVFLAAVFLRP